MSRNNISKRDFNFHLFLTVYSKKSGHLLTDVCFKESVELEALWKKSGEVDFRKLKKESRKLTDEQIMEKIVEDVLKGKKQIATAAAMTTSVPGKKKAVSKTEPKEHSALRLVIETADPSLKALAKMARKAGLFTEKKTSGKKKSPETTLAHKAKN